MKQRVIEEKLEKLGVERGTGCNIPQMHAPHARATSVCFRYVGCLSCYSETEVFYGTDIFSGRFRSLTL